MVAAFLLIAVVLTVGVVLVGTAAGLIAAPLGVRILAIAALILFLFLVARGGRRFRRLAINVSELVDAAAGSRRVTTACRSRSVDRARCDPSRAPSMP